MALDKIIDSEKLNIGLSDTAGLLREFFAFFFGDSVVPTFDWEVERVAVQGAGTTAAGFAKDIFEYLAPHYSGGGGGGGSGAATLDGRKVAMGTFTVVSQSTSLTVEHNLGEVPQYILVAIAQDETVSNHITGMIYSPYGVVTARRNSTGGWSASNPSPTVTSTTFEVTSGVSSHVLSAGATFYYVILGAKT